MVPDTGGVVADRDAGEGGENGEEGGTEAAGDGLPTAVAVGPVSKTAPTARASGLTIQSRDCFLSGMMTQRQES